MTVEKIFKLGTERPAKSLIAYGRIAPVLLCVLPGVGKAFIFVGRGYIHEAEGSDTGRGRARQSADAHIP